MRVKEYIGSKQMNLTILSFALPIMLQVFVMGSINYVDSLTVGRLGDAAVGAVAAVNRFYAVMSSAVNSIVSAAGIYVSQFTGAGNQEKVKESFRISLILTTLSVLPFLGIATLFPSAVIGFFSRNPVIIAEGVCYLSHIKYSYMPLCLSLVISNALYSTGQVKLPLYVSGGVVALKLALNLSLLGKIGQSSSVGIEEVAGATILARYMELALYLFLLKKGRYSFITRISKLFHFSGDLVKQIFVTAIPFCVNNFLWSFGNAFLLKLYGTRGEAEYSAIAITGTIHDIFVTVNGGFGSAISVLVAQRLGSSDLDRARDFAYRTYGVGLAVSVAMSAVMLGAGSLIGVVYQGMSSEVLELARRLTVLQALGFIFYQMGMHGYYILKAGGDMKSIVIMDSVATWLIQIPIVVLAACFTGAGICLLYLSSQIGELIKFGISLRLLRRERWLVNRSAVIKS